MKGPRGRIQQLVSERDVTMFRDLTRRAFPPVDVRVLDAVGDTEDFFRIGQRLGWGGATMGPTVGSFSHVGLFNNAPLTSPGSIVVLEAALLGVIGAAERVQIRLHGALGVLTHPNEFQRDRDSRWIGQSTSQATPLGIIIEHDNVAAQGTLLGSTSLALSSALELMLPAVFGPQRGITFNPSAANQELMAFFRWREVLG